MVRFLLLNSGCSLLMLTARSRAFGLDQVYGLLINYAAAVSSWQRAYRHLKLLVLFNAC